MGSDRPHVVTLIPTYNEAENIIPMLDTLAKVGKTCARYRFSTLVVDDQSPDQTGRLASEYARPYSDVVLLSKPREGLGVAMRAGYRHAVEQLGADVVVTLDCDFQWDPLEIPDLLAALDSGADVAIGSRHGGAGGLAGWPKIRRLTHWIANTVFATYVAGTREVVDHNGNFRAIRAAGILDRIRLESLPVRGYAFFNFIIYELSKLGVRFCEVPVSFRWRERGETKVSFSPKHIRAFARDTLEYIRLCLWIRWDRILCRLRT